jgi:hypothetical protein
MPSTVSCHILNETFCKIFNRCVCAAGMPPLRNAEFIALGTHAWERAEGYFNLPLPAAISRGLCHSPGAQVGLQRCLTSKGSEIILSQFFIISISMLGIHKLCDFKVVILSRIRSLLYQEGTLNTRVKNTHLTQ